MIEQVVMKSIEISTKTRAIICFGPATPITGTRTGDYWQVVIDPAMQSPGGDYIRFDLSEECEVHGWQRIDALTICEVLHSATEPASESVMMRAIDKG